MLTACIDCQTIDADEIVNIFSFSHIRANQTNNHEPPHRTAQNVQQQLTKLLESARDNTQLIILLYWICHRRCRHNRPQSVIHGAHMQVEYVMPYHHTHTAEQHAKEPN